ncbi:innexin [Elysia marginata]|uniref:Innexin n=1 Tax=Elysia marginata TaxID=1093978 RepID=A0AAV4G2J1_9GAST|nr:innexin [Elysia marginata]
MFLGVNFWTFGPEALGDSFFSKTPKITGRWLGEDVFPRMAICDFRLRQMNNVQVHSVQCVLPINIFLEKMYIFLWFFFAMLALINLYSLISWFLDLLTDRKTRQFLDKFAHVITPGKTPKNTEIRIFNSLARKYLKSDGIFLIKIIAVNTTDLLAADLLRQIWVRYKQYRQKQDSTPFLSDASEANDGNSHLGAAALPE